MHLKTSKYSRYVGTDEQLLIMGNDCDRVNERYIKRVRDFSLLVMAM